MNPIIQSRLNFHTIRKANLLKLKKAERNNELPKIEAAIHRLKGWAKELENKQYSITTKINKSC